MGPALAGLLLSFTKLPLLLTRLTYIHVGDAEIDYFGHNAFIHELIRGSLINSLKSSRAQIAIESLIVANVPAGFACCVIGRPMTR
jgi:hypothetical protein